MSFYVKREEDMLETATYNGIAKETPDARGVEKIPESSDTDAASCLCVGLTLLRADVWIVIVVMLRSKGYIAVGRLNAVDISVGVVLPCVRAQTDECAPLWVFAGNV